MTLLTVSEAARLLKLSVRTMERYRTSGLGPKYLKSGRCVRYRQSDLEAFVASRVVVDPPKLERPPGIDIIDRMLDAQDIRDRKKRMEEG